MHYIDDIDSRFDVFNDISTVDGCILSIGNSFQWVEIGQAVWRCAYGLVLDLYRLCVAL